jgi:hypothetical protein
MTYSRVHPVLKIPAEQAAVNLPNVRKLIIVIRSLTPQKATGNALAVHFHEESHTVETGI